MKTVEVSKVISDVVDRITAKSTLPMDIDVPRYCRRHLKALTEHIRPTDLVLIGGNDSSALVQSLILDLSVDGKFSSAVICDEINPESTVLFMLSVLSYIPVPALLTRQIPPEFFERFNESATTIHDAFLWFYPQEPLDLAALDEIVGELKKEREVDVLFIDSQVSLETCATLKDLARREGIVVAARSSSSDLEVPSQLADVGVLCEQTNLGFLLDYIDSREGERQTAFCYDHDLMTWSSWFTAPA